MVPCFLTRGLAETAAAAAFPISYPGTHPTSSLKPSLHSRVFEDEEKFLYGEEEERSKPQAVTVPLAQTRSVMSPVHHLSKEHQTHGLQEPKAHAMPASVPPAASGTTKVTPEECEKVRTLLRTIGLNPGMTDICKMAARLKAKKDEQGTSASLPMLKPTLEALQALSRGQNQHVLCFLVVQYSLFSMQILW